ncbi:group II intron maturase-specific domain-containing protein [Streptomyces sp. NPDC001832]|uniref:group II intron maturase-specific domain-containing protein n=1 Tax=Streptomyces sp. NPDC001832 TaxID=3154527 RepID=UPI00332A57CC
MRGRQRHGRGLRRGRLNEQRAGQDGGADGHEDDLPGSGTHQVAHVSSSRGERARPRLGHVGCPGDSGRTRSTGPAYRLGVPLTRSGTPALSGSKPIACDDVKAIADCTGCVGASRTEGRNRADGHRAEQGAARLGVADLNPVLRGWAAYFRNGNSAGKFSTIDSYVHERLAIFDNRKRGMPGRSGASAMTARGSPGSEPFACLETCAGWRCMPAGERCR